MTTASLPRARALLCALQDSIREQLLVARQRQARTFARVSGVTAADVIYEIDRVSETAIMAWFEAHWPKGWPVEVVMEGIPDGEVVTFPRGTPLSRTRWKCILDPIDGTRGIMHDKRAAWSLAALAPQRGQRTQLSDIVVAAMSELPVTKQWRADQYSAVRGGGVKATAFDVRSGSRERLRVRLSSATGFAHGFASLAKFFPPGRSLTAELEERLWDEVEPLAVGNVFDDQYISTGGQLAELLAGHDRMVGDLRPPVFRKLGLTDALACHPYDICTALILTEAGGVVESPTGTLLRAPLDTTTPVAWMAYANPALARKIRPVLRRLIKELL
jgi:fructose-1,6-bisphosphatase/inositol monophosphatase family enzyme